jgi:YesK-like protein
MFILIPFLLALIPGMIVSMVTWWFAKKGYPLFVRMLPGTVLSIAAIISFYIGFVYIRGFEGGLYGILSFFLIIFAIFSFIIGEKVTAQG